MMIPPAGLGSQEAGEAEDTEVGGGAHCYQDCVEAVRRGGMLIQLVPTQLSALTVSPGI